MAEDCTYHLPSERQATGMQTGTQNTGQLKQHSRFHWNRGRNLVIVNVIMTLLLCSFVFLLNVWRGFKCTRKEPVSFPASRSTIFKPYRLIRPYLYVAIEFQTNIGYHDKSSSRSNFRHQAQGPRHWSVVRGASVSILFVQGRRL